MSFPEVEDARRVGSYPARAHAGGGFVWDAVLEYRVWCHPERGAPDIDDGNDWYRAFATYDDALAGVPGTSERGYPEVSPRRVAAAMQAMTAAASHPFKPAPQLALASITTQSPSSQPRSRTTVDGNVTRAATAPMNDGTRSSEAAPS
jgi:hypothetical protein